MVVGLPFDICQRFGVRRDIRIYYVFYESSSSSDIYSIHFQVILREMAWR